MFNILFLLFTFNYANALTPTDIVNSYRSLYNIPPVVYNQSLESGCIEWAQKLANSGYLYHSSPNGAYGENLGMASKNAGLSFIVGQWYAENVLYNSLLLDNL